MKKLILILLLPVFVGGTDVVNFGSATPGTVPKRWSVLMTPATLIVQDTESGKQVSQVEGVSGIDDLWYDASHKRVYASGVEGLKWGQCTSISKKTQIITKSSERFQRRQAPARRFGRRNSIAFTLPLHQMTKKKHQSWFSRRSRESASRKQ